MKKIIVVSAVASLLLGSVAHAQTPRPLCTIDNTNMIIAGVRSIIINLPLWVDATFGNGAQRLAIDVRIAYQNKRACRSLDPL